MVEGKRVAVVVPAYNEATLVGVTVAGIPEYVDRIYVVDDRSTDGTVEAVRQLNDPRLELIVREQNGGVGAAIVTGYKRAIEERIDVTAVMAADNQMPPSDLIVLVEPVARGEVEYTKANRLFTGQAWDEIPHYRYLGNAVLSLLTKIASGYWHVADSQSGFTAISLDALEKLDLDRIYPRYGMPNDMLVHLNVWNARVRDVPSKPVYGVGEKSGIRLRKVVPTISWLLLKAFFWRMKEKYVIRDFHPLVFFYILGLTMLVLGVGLGIAETILRFNGFAIPPATVMLIALLVVSGLQFSLFAMWFDMESNKDLPARAVARAARARRADWGFDLSTGTEKRGPVLGPGLRKGDSVDLEPLREDKDVVGRLLGQDGTRFPPAPSRGLRGWVRDGYVLDVDRAARARLRSRGQSGYSNVVVSV